MTRQIPGYKFITALCPNLKPAWSKYRCQGSDRLDTVYSQASYRRDTVYSNSKGSEPGSPSCCRRKSFSEVQFQSLGVANSGNRPIQETRQWQHWGFADRCSFSFTKHCRSHSGAECTDAFLHPPTTQEMLSTTHMTERGLRHKIVDLPEHNAFASFSQECRIIYRIQIHSQDAESR